MAKKTRPFILAISASARKDGNSETLLKQAVAGATEAGAMTEMFRLHDMNIAPCAGCRGCKVAESGECVVGDDMQQLYPLLKKADGLILASPIYFFTISAQLKLFLDRLFPLAVGNGLRLRAKRALCCLTYAADDVLLSGCDNAARTLNDVFTYAHVPVKFVHGTAWKKGDIRKNRKVMQRAKAAGRELVE